MSGNPRDAKVVSENGGSRPGGGDSAYEKGGLLVGNFELNP